jgi:hypothetical protein
VTSCLSKAVSRRREFACFRRGGYRDRSKDNVRAVPKEGPWRSLRTDLAASSAVFTTCSLCLLPATAQPISESLPSHPHAPLDLSLRHRYACFFLSSRRQLVVSVMSRLEVANVFGDVFFLFFFFSLPLLSLSLFLSSSPSPSTSLSSTSTSSSPSRTTIRTLSSPRDETRQGMRGRVTIGQVEDHSRVGLCI